MSIPHMTECPVILILTGGMPLTKMQWRGAKISENTIRGEVVASIHPREMKIFKVAKCEAQITLDIYLRHLNRFPLIPGTLTHFLPTPRIQGLLTHINFEEIGLLDDRKVDARTRRGTMLTHLGQNLPQTLRAYHPEPFATTTLATSSSPLGIALATAT